MSISGLEQAKPYSTIVFFNYTWYQDTPGTLPKLFRTTPPWRRGSWEGTARPRFGASGPPAAMVDTGGSAELPRTIRQTAARSSVTSAISGTGCALTNLSFLTYRFPALGCFFGAHVAAMHVHTSLARSSDFVGIPTLGRLGCDDDLGTRLRRPHFAWHGLRKTR